MGHPDTTAIQYNEALVSEGAQDCINLAAILPLVEVGPRYLAAGKFAAAADDGHASQHLLRQDLLLCRQRVVDMVGAGLHSLTHAARLVISMACQPVACAVLPCK